MKSPMLESEVDPGGIVGKHLVSSTQKEGTDSAPMQSITFCVTTAWLVTDQVLDLHLEIHACQSLQSILSDSSIESSPGTQADVNERNTEIYRDRAGIQAIDKQNVILESFASLIKRFWPNLHKSDPASNDSTTIV